MSKNKSKRKAPPKKKEETIAKVDNTNYLFFPIIIILTIVPLIVRMVMVSVDSISAKQRWDPNYVDLFSRGKANVLIFFCIFLILFLIYIKKG